MGYSITKADCEMMTLEKLNKMTLEELIEQYNIINSVLERKKNRCTNESYKRIKNSFIPCN